MNNKEWKNYIRNCPSVSFLEINSGDILYLECENQMSTQDNIPIYKSPKYRPVIIFDGRQLKNHPNLTQNLDEDIDPYAYYCVPLTGTHNNKDPKHRFDIEIDPKKLHYPRNNKQPYIRPNTIFKFNSEDINYIYGHDTDNNLKQSLNNRLIGHVSEKDQDLILDEIAKHLDTQNNVLRQHFGNPTYLVKIAPNPTKLYYQLHPTGMNPFEDQALNDPDLT